MWTDFERVAFVKEIIKMTDTDVLTAFANYVQQRYDRCNPTCFEKKVLPKTEVCVLEQSRKWNE